MQFPSMMTVIQKKVTRNFLLLRHFKNVFIISHFQAQEKSTSIDSLAASTAYLSITAFFEEETKNI